MRYCSFEARERRRQAARARWSGTTRDHRSEQLGPARLGLMRRLIFEMDPQSRLPFDTRWSLTLAERAERMGRLQADPARAREIERLSPSVPLTSGAEALS